MEGSMTTTTTTPQRDWMNVGAEYTGEENDGRRRVERQIGGLTWRDVPQDGSPLSLPFSPGAAIEQLRLPRVQRVATDGYLEWPDFPGDDENPPEHAHYSIYGIECLYRDYRVRVYLLDSGTGLTPLAADRWPRDAEEAGR
jgi:hypothetical protein